MPTCNQVLNNLLEVQPPTLGIVSPYMALIIYTSNREIGDLNQLNLELGQIIDIHDCFGCGSFPDGGGLGSSREFRNLDSDIHSSILLGSEDLLECWLWTVIPGREIHSLVRVGSRSGISILFESPLDVNLYVMEPFTKQAKEDDESQGHQQ